MTGGGPVPPMPAPAPAPAPRGWSLWCVITCYQGFTLSDGALRMLVLLHLHELGRTPLALVLVLLPYEIAGVFTNLLGGWLGARFGLKVPLLLGLSLQLLACLLLAADAAWLSIPYVMATQVLSGIAKDLAKTAAKSYVRKLATPAGGTGDAAGDGGADDRGGSNLLRVVAWMTGSKNATKGLGFFVGGALLATLGFRGTNAGLAGLLAVLLLLAVRLLPPLPGKAKATLRSVTTQPPPVRWLAAARLFLFGSRDAWFAIALPLFLASTQQWPTPLVGTFLSAWVIGYGVVQAATPRLLRPRDPRHGARLVATATGLLLLPLLATAWALTAGGPTDLALVVGLCVYGAVFALDSSLHSWLVLAVAGGDDTVERVGFYYAANSLGRLLGTVASGALFAAAGEGAAGLQACLLAAAAMVVVATLCTLPVRPVR